MDDTKASKFMSLVLRHKPQEINAKLDEYGYISVSELIDGMNKKGFAVTMKDIERIVEEDNKQRYSFDNNMTKIKANQGHSINVNLELKPIQPPDILYHGTSNKFFDSIIEKGIEKRSRQYVHLSSDINVAINVGGRHGGDTFVFKVDCKQMYLDGYNFYLSENNVWLTDYVPAKYLGLQNQI